MEIECRKCIAADQVYTDRSICKGYDISQWLSVDPAHSHQEDNVGGCTMNE